MRKNYKINLWWTKTNVFVLVITLFLFIIFLNNVTYRSRHYAGDNRQLNDDYIAQWLADDPRLIDHIRRYYLYPPQARSVEYKLNKPDVDDWSQKGQPKVVEKILDGKRNGFFVEAGALDGELMSNTLYLEKRLNWTGLLVEPDYANFKQLMEKNRKAWLARACLDDSAKPTKRRLLGGAAIGALADRMSFGIQLFTRFWQPLNEQFVWCFPLKSLLLAVNRTRIDYFSLDVEGEEMTVLKSIKSDSLDINVLQVEFMVFKVGYFDKDLSNQRKKLLRSFMKEHLPQYKEMKIVLYDIIFAKEPAVGKI